MRLGLDMLGAGKYPKIATKFHPDGWAIGVFSSVFGDSRKVIERLLGDGSAPEARIQLMWSDTHTFGQAAISTAVAEARKWKQLSTQHGMDLKISPWCEHNEKAPLLYKLRDAIMNELPDCEYVNCPYKGDLFPAVTGIMNEVHGDHAPPSGNYQYSFDGTNAFDSDLEGIKAKHVRAETFYFWAPRCNLKYSMKDKTPRPQRKSKPFREYMLALRALAESSAGAKLSSKYLYKVMSEDHGGNDLKANKPVIIIPQKAKEIQFVTNEDKVVGRAAYYGPFSGGGHRYYSPKWGYEIAEDAKEAQNGKPYVDLVVNGKSIGVVHPAHRAGSFR